MNILKKIGITPEWYGGVFCEMLEALIDFCLRVDRHEVRSKKTYERFKSLIQKATGKSWEEIREMMEDAGDEDNDGLMLARNSKAVTEGVHVSTLINIKTLNNIL